MREEFISKILDIKKEKNDILGFLLVNVKYKDYYDEIENLIDNGKVIASGKHDYLLKNNKIYKKLYNPEQIELNI